MRLKQNKISKWPQFSKKEITKVGQVLKSGNVNYLYGNNGINFEKNFICKKLLKLRGKTDPY